MKNTVLLVVDLQQALIDNDPYGKEEFFKNIWIIINASRETGVEVIYVRHDDGAGEELEYGTKGWEIYDGVGPDDGERIFDKRFNSAFRETELKKYLDSKGIKNIILAGMQTEYCIDTTCRVAFEYGYKVIIPHNTTTTFDNSFITGKNLCEYYEMKIWNNRFAEVIEVEQLVKQMFGMR